MRMLRKALEAYDENDTGGKSILIKGPLSEVYTQALNEVYAKNQDSDTVGDKEGLPPANEQVLEEEVALEASGKGKKPAKQKKLKLKIKKGSFHEWLGKKPGDPITDADIEKGLKSDDPHVRKMAQFAKNAKKWHHKKKKTATEAFRGLAIESMEKLYLVSLESQQMDSVILSKMADAIVEKQLPPTDNFTTVYGVSKKDLTEDDVVDVSTELINNPDNSEFVLILDACGPGDNGTSGGVGEKSEELGAALECLVGCYNGRVYHTLKDYLISEM